MRLQNKNKKNTKKQKCVIYFSPETKNLHPFPSFFLFVSSPPLFFQALKEMSLPKRFLLLFSFRGIF